MFTGLVTDVGRVRRIETRGDARLEIETGYDTSTIEIGASIACSGTTLTVVDKGRDWFAVDVSAETLARTNIANWQQKTPVNLERPLRLGDEMGGHIVLGHVDGVGEIVSITPDGESLRFEFEAPAELSPLIASKGYVCVDGVSLTVNEINGTVFGINMIPHTRQMTTFGEAREGDRVNLEVDVLARYVARLQQA
ncbi:MAG: riboflavin synthase [Alphaproteobacteria bacterium]